MSYLVSGGDLLVGIDVRCRIWKAVRSSSPSISATKRKRKRNVRPSFPSRHLLSGALYFAPFPASTSTQTLSLLLLFLFNLSFPFPFLLSFVTFSSFPLCRSVLSISLSHQNPVVLYTVKLSTFPHFFIACLLRLLSQ